MIKINEGVEIRSPDGEPVTLWANPDQTGAVIDVPAGTLVMVMGIREGDGVYLVGYLDKGETPLHGWVASRFLYKDEFGAFILELSPGEREDFVGALRVLNRTPKGLSVAFSTRQSAVYAKFLDRMYQLAAENAGQASF